MGDVDTSQTNNWARSIIDAYIQRHAPAKSSDPPARAHVHDPSPIDRPPPDTAPAPEAGE